MIKPISIEFLLDIHPDPLKNFEIAKVLLKSVKQIDITPNTVIYTSKLTQNLKGLKKPERKIEIQKGITLVCYS